MRKTQPLMSEESRLDAAVRKQFRTHALQDEALTRFRLARVLGRDVPSNCERVADLMLGERAL